jgi:predicted type IV restriction endonuclease
MGRRKMFPGYRPEFNGHAPRSVSIEGKTFPVKSWREILLKTCEVTKARRPSEFSKILTLKGNRSPWFSRKPGDLRDPVRIVGTDIFAEANQNANSLVLRSFSVLNLFGIDPRISVEFER